MRRWLLFFFWIFVVSFAWANGEYEIREMEFGKAKEIEFGLISGLILGGLLLSTVIAGHLFLKRKVSRKVHHILAYSTLFWALVHAVYNIFFHE